MSQTRATAKIFAERISKLDFPAAFKMVADDGTYTVIGTTKASGVYHGSKDLLGRLVPLLAGFIDPPALTFEEPIVEGERAVLLASGAGTGPTGPYSQPHYAFVMRVRGDEIVEVIEFMDTGQLETGIFGRKLVAA
jgi:ketosteroid isomerase-like protein